MCVFVRYVGINDDHTQFYTSSLRMASCCSKLVLALRLPCLRRSVCCMHRRHGMSDRTHLALFSRRRLLRSILQTQSGPQAYFE